MSKMEEKLKYILEKENEKHIKNMNKSTKLNNTDIIKTSKSYEELKFLKEPNIIKTSKSCGELNNREKIDKSDEDEDEDKNYCEICDKKYNIHSWYLKHLNSKLHEKNMKSGTSYEKTEIS